MTTPVAIDHVSHSQINLWDMCPRRWEYRYVQGLKERSSGNLILGSCYHDTLEENFKQKLIHGHDIDFDILYDVFCMAWDKNINMAWDTDWGDSTPDRAKDIGIALIGTYLDDVAPSIIPIKVEETYWSKVNGIDFTLRLDLLDKNFAVIDHKTSGRMYTQDRIDKDMQASATAFVLNKPIVFYNHVAVKSGTPRIQILKTFRTRADIDWWYAKACGIVAHMQSGSAPPHEDGWWCSPKYCGYYDLCRGNLTGSYF